MSIFMSYSYPVYVLLQVVLSFKERDISQTRNTNLRSVLMATCVFDLSICLLYES